MPITSYVNPRLIAVAISFLSAALTTFSSRSAEVQSVSIKAAGPAQTLYSWTKQRCEDEYIPDSPARAIRRSDGQILLMATHRENWGLTGVDFFNLKPSCKPRLSTKALKGKGDLGMLWIQGLFTRDGVEVAALISEDRRNIEKARGCDSSRTQSDCWLNNVLAARSVDMGDSFKLLDQPHRTVIKIADAFPRSSNSRVGGFTISNIVTKGDSNYMMAWLASEGSQRPGNCLFKSRDPFEPNSWRAWDGAEFSIDMSDLERPSPCKPIVNLPGEVRSLSFVTKREVWVAVFSHRQRRQGDRVGVPGFYYATSKDLKTWSAPTLLVPSPTRPREQQNDFFTAYPSIIDPASKGRNFDTIDTEHPVLTYTVHHLVRGSGSMNRDLVYIPLRVQ